jgi:hypothetical protein
VKVLDVIRQVRERARDPVLQSITTDTALLLDLLRRRYQVALDRSEWSFLRRDTTFVTMPPYSTGTISATQGSSTVVGSGTGWTSAIVGGYMLVPDSQPLRIVNVSSPTSLDLEAPWPAASISGAAYTIVFPTISLPADCKAVIHLHNGRFRLREINLGVVRQRDPRLSRISTPAYYSKVSPSLLWLWPSPSASIVHKMLYLRSGILPSSLGDAVEWSLGEPYFLIDGVLSEVYMLAFQRTGSDHFSVLAQAANQIFVSQLDEAEFRDSALRYIPDDVRGLPIVPDDPMLSWWEWMPPERVNV